MQDEERNNLFRETKREQPAESNIVFPETSRISLQIPSSSIYIYISAVTANDSSRCCFFERNKKWISNDTVEAEEE